MLKGADSAHGSFQLLFAFYWIMTDILDFLENAVNRADGGLRFHLMLASKRIRIIIDHLKVALEEVGIELRERPGDEYMRRILGAISVETLENIRGVFESLIKEQGSGGRRGAFWLSYKLTEIADVICIVSSLLKHIAADLNNCSDERSWRVFLILQIVVRDLEVIVNVHHHLASNPGMLIKDLRLNS
ncbi:MAG: hypothetical protein QXU02_02840 [Candidatus Bathyarchaeia archaeon]